MKKFLLFLVSAVVLTAVGAPTLPLYPVQRSKAPVEGAAVVERPDATVLLFKLKAGTNDQFGISNIYIYLDENPKTGRKNIGNEYYIDINKRHLSSYSADGAGKLHRRAVQAHRAGEWYYILIENQALIHGRINAARFIFKGKFGSGLVMLRAPAVPKQVTAPQLPAVGARRMISAPPKAKKSSPAPAAGRTEKKNKR